MCNAHLPTQPPNRVLYLKSLIQREAPLQLLTTYDLLILPTFPSPSCREFPPQCRTYYVMPAIVLQNIRKLGVLGGTFDPIHYGHLQIAEEARGRFALDAVLFIPAGEPPHKPHGQASAEQRFVMTELATADHPQFAVSRLEIDRPGAAYTIDTLQALREQYPEAALYLIMGADMAMDFPTWREPARILSLARVIAVTRPGVPEARLRRHLATPAMQGVELLVAPGLDLSSTELRRRAREGKSLRYLTPDAVIGFIEKEGLYRV